MVKNFKMVAKTLFGMEELLANELRQLGASSIELGTRNVSFEGDKGFMYKANLCCRTAIKILKPITAFNIFTEEDLYKRVYEMPWEDYMDVKGTLAVNATVFSDVFTHSQYISLKTKDAIVDRFRDRQGTRPDVDLDHPTLRINVHIDRNICTISLDSSGESLHKRGYKVESTLAPINEVLAAGMLMLSGWQGQCNFLDPMCGGGTILTEAAMIACNIPPNLNREEFGFETWPDFDVDLYEKIEEAALKKVRDFPHKIYGFDTDPVAIKKAKENIKSANLQDFIEVKQQDFFQSEKEHDKPLYIVFNPPYDERIAISDVENFYSSIGNTLKRGYPGTQAWMITSNMEALKSVGLHPSKKIKLFNGKLEAKLVRYEMYEGSRKASKQ
ncbi:putative N6-adenine-specific DNA methylase [Aequorivita sublithincola DSM 14238]|uniref:Putative N6-adenine-specific DNA methylase n=1 Tax=Aequorivita sublithincola (strain DSM 14238 / LMG 21431 / ACAM 643 / 9-3) TaxID=746697 RepID=I3YZ82_AEQSU|nr:THUMP domain-containing protein [Aequorivita sublithincola]AFL82300.1 putative N6-adenine-specific DNA methylase [Aequorivita sublithincola DSM 14238]